MESEKIDIPCVRRLIWEEMKHASTNAICLELYTDKVRRYNRWWNCAVTATIVLGTLSFKVSPYITLIASALVAIAEFLKNLTPLFLQPDEELFKLDCLMAFYNSYFNDLELLWIQLEGEELDDKGAAVKFHKLKRKETEKLPEMNRYVRSITDEEIKEYQNRSDNHLKTVFYEQNTTAIGNMQEAE